MNVAFGKAAGLAPGPRRTAAIAAWFQGLFEAAGQPPPVLVGGSAVELYTAGAYTSGDLDFIGAVPATVASELRAAGFAKQGRHWVHEEAEVFLELPGSGLEPWEGTARIEVGGYSVIALGLEEVLTDCLAAWKFWHSEVDAINAYRLWSARPAERDATKAGWLAKKRAVADSFDLLERFVAALSGRDPTDEELRAWARPRG